MWNKKISLVLSIVLFFSLIQISYSNVQAVENNNGKSITRLQGTTRFKTSIAIADTIDSSNQPLDNVVLTSGYNFPDGLSGGILAKKLNAPLLMAGNLSDSQDALNFIFSHLKQNGNVYILGGTSAIGQDTQNALTDKGYKVYRICGKDRIETNNSIVDNLNLEEGTPVFIASAYGFADALSASSISSIYGYPILLSGNDNLPELTFNQLSKIKPSSVYIVGGTGVISSNIENALKSYLPSANIIRLSGINRFETSLDVFDYFSLNTKNIILSSGKDFPDALCGSQLAAKLNAFLVLADENNLSEQQKDYDKKGIKNFYILGGSGALNNNVETTINSTPGTNDPSPSIIPSPSPSAKPTPSIKPTPSAKPTPSIKPTPSAKPTPSIKPTPSANPIPSIEPTPSAKPTPSIEPIPSAKPTPTPSTEPTPSAKPTPSIKPTPSAKPTPTPSTEPTPSAKPTPSIKPTPSAKPTPTPSTKPTPTPSIKPTPTPGPGPSTKFNFAVEESLIKNIYVEQDNAIRNKDIENFMLYIDKNSPIYSQTEKLFSAYVNQFFISINNTSYSFTFNFSDDYTAVVTSKERKIVYDYLFGTKSYNIKIVTTKFKKINGKWMIYDSNLLK
ncbi:MAG: cell wall-binding repeat-containing protein [Bacillota bacterium]|nr:cell wall-binding repeat-containing protein [Bacillota bacterium]